MERRRNRPAFLLQRTVMMFGEIIINNTPALSSPVMSQSVKRRLQSGNYSQDNEQLLTLIVMSSSSICIRASSSHPLCHSERSRGVSSLFSFEIRNVSTALDMTKKATRDSLASKRKIVDGSTRLVSVQRKSVLRIGLSALFIT